MPAHKEWEIINGSSYKCDNCDEICTTVFICQECNQQLCSDCDILKHKSKKFSSHQRQRKTDGTEEHQQYLQIKQFRQLMFGSPNAQEIENAEFIACSDKLFDVQLLQNLYKECKENPKLSMLKFIIAEVRDACKLKEEFDKVLCQTQNLDCLERATTNDFIICLMDACKHISQKQTIFECLVRFDYPVVLGHKFCGLHVTEQAIYGLHLSELNHLMFCGMVENEASHKHSVVLSLGTDGSYEKTAFLNTIWKTKFEKWSKASGIHHEGQLELLLGTESSKRTEHILDLHGSLNKVPLVVLKALFHSADLVLFHCNAFDFNFTQHDLNKEFKSFLQNVNENNENINLVLLVHGIGKELFDNINEIVKENIYKNISKATKFRVLMLTQDWQEKKQLVNYHRAINEIISVTSSSYNSLQRLYDSLNSINISDGLPITKTVVPNSLLLLRENARNVINKNEKTCSSWFPLHANSSKIAYLDDKQYETVNIDNSIRQEIENTKKLRVADLYKPVGFFRDEIVSNDSFDDTALAFTLFQQELNQKFQPIISKYRQQLKQLKDDLSLKPLKEQKLALQKTLDELVSNDIAGVHFIRELIERGKDKIDDKAVKGAVNVCQSELLIGRSIEVVNGDSLTISTDFLQTVFEPVFQAVQNGNNPLESECANDNGPRIHKIVKYFQTLGDSSKQLKRSSSDFISLTVIGVESSGKSTLWNELWNSNFPVAHGKCSRGFWSSLVQVKNGPTLLVNDTEGILSPICVRPRFDQKLVLLAFALSNIVIINVKGEGDSVLINLLKLVIYAAHKLSLFHRPQIVFVHRDVVGQRECEKGKFKNDLLSQLREACEAMEQSGEKIVLDDIIDTSLLRSFDLPSAIGEPQQEVAGKLVYKEERTPEFIIRCRELRQELIHMARDMCHVQDENRQFMKSISGDYGWISYANHVWDLAKQNASLWTFASVNEKLQRNYIEKQLGQLVHKHISHGLRLKGMEQIKRLMSNESDTAVDNASESANFATFLAQLELEYQAIVEKELKVAMHNFPGTVIPSNVALEYVRKANRLVSDGAEEQRQMLAKKQQDRRLQDSIKLKFLEVLKKIEQLDTNSSEKDVEKFFNTFVKEATIQMEATQKQQNISDKQAGAHAYYCLLHSELDHPFAPEFVKKFTDGHLRKTAEMLNETFWTNVSTHTTPVNFHGDKLPTPFWATVLMPNYKEQPTSVVKVLYKLQDTVYKALWQENMKKSEIGTNDWQQLIKDLCLSVDKNFVAPLRKEGISLKEKFYNVVRTRSIQSFKPGYLQSLTNSMHTFTCMMFLYFLEFHHKHEVETEKQKFHEYCNERKKEAMLRAQHARSVADAAKTTVEQLIHKIIGHTNQKALKDVEESLQLWIIEPEELTNEAIQKTFQARNADNTFEYITKPLKFLKQLFRQHYTVKVSEVIDIISYDCFDNKNTASYIKKTLAQLKAAIVQWQKSVNGKTLTNDSVRLLFLTFRKANLGFLNEIQDSVLKYLDNTLNVKNIAIDQTQFATELQKQLTKYTSLSEKMEFNFPKSKYKELFEELWPKARGCEELCPYCKEKCCGGSSHIKHFCNHHLLHAFRGWRGVATQDPWLRICSDPLNFTYYTYEVPKSTTDQESETQYIPLGEHIQQFNPTWQIVPNEDEVINKEEKIAWLMLRERLAEYYNYKTTTPPEWESIYRN